MCAGVAQTSANHSKGKGTRHANRQGPTQGSTHMCVGRVALAPYGTSSSKPLGCKWNVFSKVSKSVTQQVRELAYLGACHMASIFGRHLGVEDYLKCTCPTHADKDDWKNVVK